MLSTQRGTLPQTQAVRDLNEKLRFMERAARYKDYTELSVITEHLAEELDHLDFTESYAHAKALEISARNQSESILDDVKRFISFLKSELNFR